MSSRLDGLDELMIPGVDVPPGVRTTAFVGVGDERDFRVAFIEIDRDCAPAFQLLGFRIGGAEQFMPDVLPIPAEVFAGPNVGRLLVAVCRRGGALELDVRNTTAKVQRFAVTFAGRWMLEPVRRGRR